MSIEQIEKMGEFLCDAIHTLKEAGLPIPFIDTADKICSAAMPDLKTLSLADGAQLAEAAYEALLKVKSKIIP